MVVINNKIYNLIIASIIALSTTSVLNAQNVPTAGNPIANPLTGSDLLRRELPTPLSRPDELVIPLLTQDMQVAEAEKIKLTLKEVNFEGNTVISSEELKNIFASSLSKEISVADLLALIKQTTIFYKEKGYVLSQAFLPEQKVDDKQNAKIKIGIIEGYISKYVINSKILTPTTKKLIEQYAEKLTAEKPLTRATLERYALFIDDIPGSKIQLVFEQSETTGAADVEIIADNSKLVGFDLFTNNRGTRAIGPKEHSGSIYQFNGFYGNQSSITRTITDNRELTLYAYKHRQPLNSDGLAFNFIATRARTKPDYRALPALTRAVIDTPGKSNTYLGELEYGAIRSRQHNLVLKLKLNATDSNSKILGQDLFKEQLRMMKFEVIYDWLDPLFFGIISHTLLSLEATQGIEGLGSYIKPEKGLTTRPNVDDDFKKFNVYLSRTQPLVQLINLRLQGFGQLASDELVSSEEFGFGGRVIGHGYDAYQIAGDHGIAGKAELDINLPFMLLLSNTGFTPDNFLKSEILNFSPTIYGFYDGGRVWNKYYRKSFQKEHDSAVSRGFGVRGTFAKYLIFDAYVAEPMTRVAANEQDKQPRYFFNVGILYN